MFSHVEPTSLEGALRAGKAPAPTAGEDTAGGAAIFGLLAGGGDLGGSPGAPVGPDGTGAESEVGDPAAESASSVPATAASAASSAGGAAGAAGAGEAGAGDAGAFFDRLLAAVTADLAGPDFGLGSGFSGVMLMPKDTGCSGDMAITCLAYFSTYCLTYSSLKMPSVDGRSCKHVGAIVIYLSACSYGPAFQSI